MKQIMVRYKVWPDDVAANVELVRAVYDELHLTNPDGLRYATFQLDDGVSFIHLHSDASPDGDALRHVAAFGVFQEGIADRCEDAPVVTELREVGSYQFPESYRNRDAHTRRQSGPTRSTEATA